MSKFPHSLLPPSFVAIAGLLLMACPEPDAEECTPGEYGCQCNLGQCLGGLTCLPNNICTDDGGEGGGDGDCYEGADYKCVNGHVYWFDSCGNQTNLKEECVSPQTCVDAPNGSRCEGIGNCGDGIIEKDKGEECEGADHGGATCQTLGFGMGTLVCTEVCTLNDLGCDRCGDGLVDPLTEECDGGPVATCQQLGYELGGTVSCTSQCEHDTSGCISGDGDGDEGDGDGDAEGDGDGDGECECNSGPCCENNCDFRPAGFVCDANAQTEYGCPWGTEADSDVGVQTRDQQCSGNSAQCDGNYGPWSDWSVADACSTNELCEPGQMSCQACSYTYDVTQYECQNFSAANGAGPGGGEIMRICATTDPDSGYMTVKARKHDGSTFSSRPYQVRVSNVEDDPCGPDTYYFTVSDSDPVNIGTTELTFSFAGAWLGGQTQKAYCVTASTKPGDLGYDANNPNQQSWWFSDKAVVVKQCN